MMLRQTDRRERQADERIRQPNTRLTGKEDTKIRHEDRQTDRRERHIIDRYKIGRQTGK